MTSHCSSRMTQHHSDFGNLDRSDPTTSTNLFHQIYTLLLPAFLLLYSIQKFQRSLTIKALSVIYRNLQEINKDSTPSFQATKIEMQEQPLFLNICKPKCFNLNKKTNAPKLLFLFLFKFSTLYINKWPNFDQLIEIL